MHIGRCQNQHGVAQAIMEKYIPYFGCPKVLVTDKGKENVNSEISLLCSKFNIKHVTSSTFHPQSNGLIECRQQMILNYLWKITTSADTQGIWPNLLHEFQLITNSTFSQTQGFSPFFLTFFRTPNFLFNIVFSDHHLHHNTFVSDKLNNAKQVLQTACDNYNASFKENNTPNAPMQKSIQEGSIVYVQHTQRDFDSASSKKQLPSKLNLLHVVLKNLKEQNLYLINTVDFLLKVGSMN